ncbi:uncharacterized protein LOC128551269 isoform X2 [Mercenaria mercenaria]|uniref:uncharacterized protein LOC128551269 isoform X2 n=1 Tax=Mercenaria mercenaria TaxID=6596 RepID=UPI00234F0F64|nr:uncharacterized protein LOC128551269 isoform X2 [Mercenaria mercenaria]
MSEGQSTGTLNPAFDLNGEREEVNDQQEVEADVQVTRFGGKESDTEGSLENRNTYTASNDDEIEVKETVLDILRRSQKQEEADKGHNGSERDISKPHDVRITIPEPGDFAKEKVSDITNGISEYSTAASADSSGETNGTKDDARISDMEGEDTKEQLQGNVQSDEQITRESGKKHGSKEGLEKRNTYTVSNKINNEEKETVLDILMKSQKDSGNKETVQRLEDATVGQTDTEETRFTIADEVDKKKVSNKALTQTYSLATPSNGRSSSDSRNIPKNKLGQSLSLSLSKAEQVPPLDPNTAETSRQKVQSYFSTCEWTYVSIT